jgi:excinuclease UvrABC ATPase subunit
MKKKVLFLSFLFALLVYGVLFTYVFAISPIIKEKSISGWLVEEETKKPKYMEKFVCGECHFEVYKALISGNHSSLECEVCHGVGYDHSRYRTADSIVVDSSRDACLTCHKDVEGREVIHTVGEDHHTGVKCVVCHSPHG